VDQKKINQKRSVDAVLTTFWVNIELPNLIRHLSFNQFPKTGRGEKK